MRTQRGFTLIELLIAVSIFAVLAVIAYGGLGAVLNSREQGEKTADRLSELQMALTIMQRDIEQATTRSVRDEFGDSKDAFIGSSQSGSYIELTSSGHSNPLKRTRSILQRVAYHFSEGELSRATWVMLDAPQEAVANKEVILSGLEDLNFRYLDSDRKWQQGWPPESTGSTSPPARPIAVEVVIEYKEWGEIKRLFRLVDDPQ